MSPLAKLLIANRANPVRRFDVTARADGVAEVFLYDAIVSDEDEAMAMGGVAPAAFVKALRAITAPTIHLRINSPGGSVFGARAIEQALRDHPAQVTAYVDGVAASAATFVAMAADQVVMAPGALWMVHKAWGMAFGNADDMLATAELLDKIDGTLAKTYAARTDQSTEQILQWMAAETWFTADEAVAAGFADSVSGQADAQSATRWDLSAYANAPAAAPAPPPPPTPQPQPFDAAAAYRRLAAALLTA